MVRSNARVAAWSVVSLLAVGCLVTTGVRADELTLDREVNTILSMSEAQRQSTTAANVPLTDAEGVKFWPIYRAYRSDVAKVNARMVEVLKDLAVGYDSLSDAQARSITKRSLEITKQRAALKAKYIGKCSAVLSPIKTARVLQVENKLDAFVEIGFAEAIPFVSLPSE
jgi:hypothetical protein